MREPRSRTRRLVPAGLAVLLAAAVGCGGKFTPVPVGGVVTLDGKPVEGATIYFYAVGDEKDGRPAHGTTDKAGDKGGDTAGDTAAEKADKAAEKADKAADKAAAAAERRRRERDRKNLVRVL